MIAALSVMGRFMPMVKSIVFAISSAWARVQQALSTTTRILSFSVRKRIDQGLFTDRLRPPVLVVHNDLRARASMSTEVNDMRLMLQEGLLEVSGTDGQYRDHRFEQIAILGGAGSRR